MINSTVWIILAEAEHFLTLFLGFGRFSAWFSYKSFSYKKKTCIALRFD